MNKLMGVLLMAFPLTACGKVQQQFHTGLVSVQASFVPSNNPHKIIVLAGQSNMVGAGQTFDFPSNSRVHMVGNSVQRVGPGYNAASRIADDHPSWDITVVQCALGGSSIHKWVPGEVLYNNCLTLVGAQSGKEIIGFLWYQGESDAWSGFDPKWNDEFQNMVGAFRADFNSPLLPVVWAQLGRNDDYRKTFYPNWVEFKANQAKLQMQAAIMVITDDQPVVEFLHHEYWANQAIGERFYRAYLNLITG